MENKYGNYKNRLQEAFVFVGMHGNNNIMCVTKIIYSLNNNSQYDKLLKIGWRN